MAPGELPLRADVLADLFNRWSAPLVTERIRIEDALGRVLAADAVALCDKPVVRGSGMDGVAVKSERFAGGIPDASAWVRGVDYVRADTGDDFDDAFDAVVVIEDVEFLEGGGIKFLPDTDEVRAGTNVTPKGSAIKKGNLICPKGTRLVVIDVAAIAMGGVSEVEVYKKPICAFIPTGTELIPIGQLPERGQTVNSNSLLAKLMIEEFGAEPLIFPIIRDDKAALTEAFEKALACADIVVLGAGTSKGDEDYCHAMLAERGDSICHGVASAPGKPLALAVVDGKPVINVAGPPIACFNGLEWCVRAVVSSFFGLPPAKRLTVQARLSEGLGGSGPLFEAFIRLQLEKTENGYIAHPLERKPGSAPDSLRTEGLYIAKPEPEPVGKGDLIEVELLRYS